MGFTFFFFFLGALKPFCCSLALTRCSQIIVAECERPRSYETSTGRGRGGKGPGGEGTESQGLFDAEWTIQPYTWKVALVERSFPVALGHLYMSFCPSSSRKSQPFRNSRSWSCLVRQRRRWRRRRKRRVDEKLFVDIWTIALRTQSIQTLQSPCSWKMIMFSRLRTWSTDAENSSRFLQDLGANA